MTKVEQQRTAQETLGLIKGAKKKIEEAEEKKKEEQRQSAVKIVDAIGNFVSPLVDQLPKSLIVRVGTFLTPEDHYITFVIYTPASNRLLSRSFLWEGEKLINPHTREAESEDWLDHGGHIVSTIETAISAKKSGIDQTLPVQLSWHKDLPPGVDIPSDLLDAD